MNITDINSLVKAENFQKAIVEYDTYMLQYPELIDNLYISRHNAYKNLTKKLHVQVENAIEYSRAWNGPSSSSETGINLFHSYVDSEDSKLLDRLQWWRLDFVIAGATVKEKVLLPLSIFKNKKYTIQISADFYTSEMISIFIAYHEDSGVEEFSHGIEYFDSSVIAFYMCKLNQGQIVEQIISMQLNKFDLVNGLKEFQNLIKEQDSLKNKISEYLYNHYVRYFNFANGINAETSLYLFHVLQLLNNETSTYLKLPNINPFNYGLLDGVLNSVSYKAQLGNGVNFNIEGFKIISNIFILHGWIIDPSKKICSLRISHPECHQNFELLPQILKCERLDVIKYSGDSSATIDTHFGFTSVTNAPPFLNQRLTEGWTVNCTTVEGINYTEQLSLVQLPSNMDGLAIALNIVPNQTTNFDQCRHFFKPVFDAYRKVNQASAEDYHHTFDFKPYMQRPAISVIVPLYGKTRFELTQIPVLAALRRADWEIIFAVDDPSILEEVKGNIYRLSMLYGISISIVAPSVNLGFAGINNFAVKYARSDLVLFLNSDCFITNNLAIDQALAWMNTSLDSGAVGFRLVYADRTIQHDGMSLAKWKNNADFYLNDHPRQGFDEHLVANIIDDDESTLLTAACLMVKKSLFLEVSGFDCDYFKGDFEDSDLCLKIIAKNRNLGIIRQPGIYHLERQSISSIDNHLRERITMTNSFIYTERWAETLNTKLPSLRAII